MRWLAVAAVFLIGALALLAVAGLFVGLIATLLISFFAAF